MHERKFNIPDLTGASIDEMAARHRTTESQIVSFAVSVVVVLNRNLERSAGGLWVHQHDMLPDGSICYIGYDARGQRLLPDVNPEEGFHKYLTPGREIEPPPHLRLV